MIDKSAFHSLSYGLYIIATKAGGRRVGCVANTFQQVTSAPLQVSVALNKENATTRAILEVGRFTASCLSQEAAMELIGTFGFRCSDDVNKFAACEAGEDAAGVPYVAEQCVSWFSVRVVQTLDLGSHLLFVGEVEEAQKAGAGDPMTYAHYHLVKGGKTPPKASSYLGEDPASEAATAAGSPSASAVAAADEPDGAAAASADVAGESPSASGGEAARPKYAWRCKICGHLEYADELPDDFTCPLCGMGKDMFERVEL